MSIVWLLISLGAGAVMGFIVGRQSYISKGWPFAKVKTGRGEASAG